MPVVLIYARVSKDKTEQRISVDRQLSRCRKYAAEHFPKLPVVEFEDNDKSAADPDVVRSGFNEMTDFMRVSSPGDIATVIVNEQSRLTRQESQWGELMVTFAKAGISTIHTMDQGQISVDAGNRLVASIIALIDAEEVARTKKRMKAGYEQLRSEGRPGGVTGGYGYRKAVGADGRKTLEIVPEQAAAIRYIAALVMDGLSLAQISRMLNAKEIDCPGREHTNWSPTTVRGMLVKPSIAGLRSRSTRVHEKAKTTYEQVIGRAIWEPIISLEERDQLLSALNRREIMGEDGRPHTVKRRSRAES